MPLKRSALTLALLWPLAAAAAPTWEPTGSGADLYNEGRSYLELKNPRKAEGVFRKLLGEQPECGICAQGLAYSLLFQNRSAEAKAVLEGAVQRFPEEPQLYTTLSEAAFAAQDFGASRKAAEAAVRLDPESLDAQMALQAVMLRTGDYGGAGKALDAAQLHLPGPELACLEAELALEKKEIAEARELLRECKASAREDLVTTVEGLVAQASGRTAEAGQLMGTLGVDAVSQVVLAADRYNSGDYAGSLAILDVVLRQNPDRLDARIIRGQARAALKDRDGARQDLELAFKGDTWVEVHSTGMMSGILRKSDEEKLDRMVLDGAALLARILVEDGDPKHALEIVGRAKASARTGGKTPASLIGAEALALSALKRSTEAWKLLSDAILAGETDPILRETASQLAHASLSDAPPVVLAAIRSQGPAAARYNLASALFNYGRPADCFAEVAATPPAERLSLDASTLKLMDQLGYRCAVATEDLKQSDARLAMLGLGTTGMLPAELASTGFNHALMLSEAGRKEDALAVLGRASPTDKRARQKAQALRLTLLVDLQRWDEAVAVASDPDADPRDVAWLGSALVQAERPELARPMLTRACPRLTGEDAASCKEILAGLDE